MISYFDQIRDSLQANEGYEPAANPVFYQALQLHFPGAMPLSDYMQQTADCLSSYGFCDENTMGMVAMCRDEIAEPLLHEVIRYWGKTFNCCSLAGFVTIGKTGLAAAMAHTPIFDGIRRFAFYAMPHIAISKQGEVGNVYRDGIQKVSHACGSLDAIVEELALGHLKLQMDMQDIEQTIVRQKILSTIQYGDQPNLVEITQLACEIIASDVKQLLNDLDHAIFHYSVAVGVQIHGPNDTHWIYPEQFYLMNSQLSESCIDLSTRYLSTRHTKIRAKA